MKKGIRPKTIVFTGFEHKKDCIEKAKERGFLTVLLTTKKNGKEASVFDEVIEVDFYKKSAVDDIIPYLRKSFNIKAIISNYEKYVVPRSYLAEKLGVIGTSVYGACCSRNKLLQRYALSVMKENIPWKKIKTFNGLQKGFESFNSATFLKFISGIKSRCIYYLDKKANLKTVWKGFTKSLDNLDLDFQEDYKYLDFRFDYPDPRKNFLLEKAVSGDQISVSSFAGSHNVWSMPSICDVYPAHTLGRDDSFLAFRILPSKHSDSIVKEAHKVTETASKILGLRYCGIFADLMITPEKEIKIIEIASRIGGYREQMYQEAYNVSLSEQLINVATGKGIKPPKKICKYISLIELFPVREGIYKGISDPQNYLKDVSVKFFTDKASKIGDLVGLAREGFSPVERVFVSGKTYQEVYEKSVQISMKCVVEVE